MHTAQKPTGESGAPLFRELQSEETEGSIDDYLTPGIVAMPNVVFVLGLCGSGKSKRAKELTSQGFMSFDEKSIGRPVHPDLQTWPNSAYPEFVQAVIDGKNCVVTEVAFYIKVHRQHVTSELTSKRPDVVIEWECFDTADLEVANFNCEHDPERTDDGIRCNLEQNLTTVQNLKNGTYELPADHKCLKTVRRA